VLDDAIKSRITAYLRDNFISQGKDLSVVIRKQQIRMLIQSVVASGRSPGSARNLKCSTASLSRFPRRNGLSFRRRRLGRHPALNDQECLNK
jgi:hypothetical protein